MASKSVRLEESVYEEIKARKRDDETFSEAIERLLGGPSLMSIAGILSDEDAEAFRDAIDVVDAKAIEDVDEILERVENE